MARYDDEDEDDDLPKKRRRKSSEGSNTTMIVVIVLLVGLGGGALLCCLIMPALLLPAVQQSREAARRVQSKNNLKQIGLAAHNFHDTFQHFPPADAQPEDQPQSWMTDLLPFVDQASLYTIINRKAPWDDPSNRSAMSSVVPAYLNPSVPNTSFQDPVTGLGIAHYAGNPYVFDQEKPRGIRDMTDGSSSTMLAGSVAAGFRPWSDPGNLRDPANGVGPGPTQYLHGYPGSGGANILMADGSVRFISENAAPGVMAGLAKPDDAVLPGEF